MFRAAFNSSAVILAPRLRGIMTQAKCFQSTGEDEKTTATILNQEIDAGLMIDSFSQNGFRFNNGMNVVGPIALFPKSILSWRVRSSADISEDSLSLFYLLEPKLDILIIGVGDKGSKIHPRVLQYMRNKRIGIEVLPTETACTTFNFLNSEKRCVAAALIPPVNMRATDEDLVESQVNKQQLFKMQGEDYF